MRKDSIIKIWFGVNRDGYITLHLEQPVRDDANGVWRSERILCDSAVYKQITDAALLTGITWDDDPGYMEFTLRKI